MKMLVRAALALLAALLPIGAIAQAAPVLAYPAPQSLDGTEQMLVLQTGGWKLISFAQVQSWTKTSSIVPLVLGPTSHTLAYPNVSSLDGTEEFLIFQGGGWKVYGTSQLKSFLTGAAPTPLVVNPLYPQLANPGPTLVDGTEQFLLFQDGRWEASTLTALQTWVAAGGGGSFGQLDFSNTANSAFIL